MADDTNFRSYRPADQRWPTQPAPASGGREAGHERSDPLAELARLIGQTDPFADLKPGAPRAAAPVPARPAPAAPQPPLRAATPASVRPNDPYGSPLQFSGKQFDNYSEPPQHEAFQPAYDPAIYGAPPQQPPGHPTDAYYEDPARVPHGEDSYEEEYGEERPRRGLKLAVAAIVVLVLGVSGVVGYRSIFSGVPSGTPPVIKASTTPSKIAPVPSTEAANKQIYDRVGDPSQGERVVSREEKPVEVKDNSKTPSRVVFPGMPTTPSNAQDTAMNTASPPLNTDPGGPPISAEPKKIKTVPIRPEGTGSATAPRSNAAPANTRTAAAQPAPATAQAAPQANAPLSLSPQATNAEASARPAFPPPPTPRQAAPAPAAPTRLAAIPPATEVAAGAYTVQISSQRSESEANASFRSLQAKFPSVLGDRSPIIRRADLGDKGVYFRAMVGPFASQDQATQFCGSLKSAGGQCVVQRN